MDESAERVRAEVLKEKGGPLAWTFSSLTEFASVTSGEEMAPLLLSLLKLERVFQEKGMKGSPKQSIPGINRPAIVGTWITAGRCDRSAGQNMNVAPAQLGKLEADFRKWWDGMQPGWRIRDKDGNWDRGSYEGDWGNMVCPGRNGMLSVVATLSWWGRKVLASEHGGKKWKVMVDDVKWVVDGLMASM